MMCIVSAPITSSEQWHEMRRHNVGCSEVGALFGCHDYLTGFALAARKMGLLEDTVDNAVLQRGRLLEPVARQLLAEMRPDWQQIETANYYEDTSIRFGCTPDLFVRDPERGVGVVQIKTVAPQIFARKWHNDAGAIEPPLWIAIQAMGEQHLTRSDFAYVAALVVGYGLSLELIEVPYLPDVIESARERVFSFWEMVDAGKLPPPDYGQDGAYIAKVFAQDDGSELDLTGDNELPEIIEQFEALKMARQTAQDGIDEAQAKIMARLGAAQSARFAGGVINAKTVQRKAYTVPASSYRRLTVKRERARADEDAA
jgi:predicted phage-related endonuclease